MSSPPIPRNVVLIGFGTIAQSHCAALESLPGLRLIAAIDPSPATKWLYRGLPPVTYPSIDDYPEVTLFPSPDTVVVATPTGTHVALATLARRRWPHAEILVEKPLAAPGEDPSSVLADPLTRPIYHLAFSPEVLWAKTLVASRTLGPPVGFTAQFTDNYASDPSSSARLLNSWYDVVPNALSVLSQFFTLGRGLDFTPLPGYSSYKATLELFLDDSPVYGPLMTSWAVPAPAQSTKLYFADSVLEMNHTSVSTWLAPLPSPLNHQSRDSSIEAFLPDPLIPRRQSHYTNLYAAYAKQGLSTFDDIDTSSIQRILQLLPD